MIMSVDFLAKEGNGTYIALFPFSFIDAYNSAISKKRTRSAGGEK